LIGPAKNSFLQAQQLNPNAREADLALLQLSRKGFGARLRGWWRQLFNR
jgi:hypothetical protein